MWPVSRHMPQPSNSRRDSRRLKSESSSSLRPAHHRFSKRMGNGGSPPGNPDTTSFIISAVQSMTLPPSSVGSLRISPSSSPSPAWKTPYAGSRTDAHSIALVTLATTSSLLLPNM